MIFFSRIINNKTEVEKVSNELTESKIMQALDWAYDKAINGVAGLDSAQELASSYMKESNDPISQANSLIRWQNTKAGTSGFLTGLGGLITMPITLPANITSVIFVQVRMIAAIAHLGGHDLKDDRVKAMVYACLTGNAAKDILKDIGIVVGRKLTESAIKGISAKTITKINQAVGFRLLTKFGEKGVINLGKAIPLVGGIVGATFDSVTTNMIGNIARDTFIVMPELV
ncbi:EcsC family protein [Vibrio cholerae]|nr:EcsC family protein [Vibrio cholerae]